MDCQRAEEALNALVDNELSERDSLDAHLAECAECRATAETILLQNAELRQAFAPHRQAAAALAERVVRRLPDRPPVPDSAVPARRPAWGQLLLAAAAGFLLALVVFQPWQSRPTALPDAGAQRPHTVPERVVKPPTIPPALAHLAVATGPVEMRLPDQKRWHVLNANAPVAAGARVRTPNASCCEFRCADGSEIRLNAGAELVFVGEQKLELAAGQLWSALPAGSKMYEIAVPTAGATVCGAGAQFDLACPAADAILTVASGSAQVLGQEKPLTVQSGEQARIAGGRVVDCNQVQNLVAATRWVHEVLLLKGRKNPELALRVNQLLAELGQTKMSYLCEEEIRSLGDHCVEPLTCYVQSPLSQNEPDKRVAAIRILSDIAQPYSIPDLMELLADENPEVRGCAAVALARLTGHDQGRSAEQWRTQPLESCLETYNTWREWWARNKDRYPGVPGRMPEKKMPEARFKQKSA